MGPLNLTTLAWNYIPFVPKGTQGIFDNQKVDESIQYTLRAIDEDCRGDGDVALDLYFEALSSLLDAIPVGTDAKRNKLINHKFTALLARKCDSLNIAPQPRRSNSDMNLRPKSYQPDSPPHETSTGKPVTLSDRVVQAAVAGAVALKQSPLPDALLSTVSYTIQKAQAIDKYIGVQNMCWEVSKVGLTKAIELDEQYRLHEKVSTALMTSATAVIKAGIAYQEAASYQQMKTNRNDSNH